MRRWAAIQPTVAGIQSAVALIPGERPTIPGDLGATGPARAVLAQLPPAGVHFVTIDPRLAAVLAHLPVGSGLGWRGDRSG